MITRHIIEKGLLLRPMHAVGRDGREYLAAVLEYQLTNLDGTPATYSYRGPAAIDGSKMTIGDPWNDTRLTEATVADEPTQRSSDLLEGFRAALEEKRYPRNPHKRYPERSVDWWDGHAQAWQDRRSADS